MAWLGCALSLPKTKVLFGLGGILMGYSRVLAVDSGFASLAFLVIFSFFEGFSSLAKRKFRHGRDSAFWWVSQDQV